MVISTRYNHSNASGLESIGIPKSIETLTSSLTYDLPEQMKSLKVQP